MISYYLCDLRDLCQTDSHMYDIIMHFFMILNGVKGNWWIIKMSSIFLCFTFFQLVNGYILQLGHILHINSVCWRCDFKFRTLEVRWPTSHNNSCYKIHENPNARKECPSYCTISFCCEIGHWLVKRCSLLKRRKGPMHYFSQF